MTHPPNNDRQPVPVGESKTLAEYAAEAARKEGGGAQIAGKPADVCPYCGCGMFATGTRQGEGVTFRYVHCRNRSCGKRFYAKQPPATIVRELEDEGISSSSGQTRLTVVRESA